MSSSRAGSPRMPESAESISCDPVATAPRPLSHQARPGDSCIHVMLHIAVVLYLSCKDRGAKSISRLLLTGTGRVSGV